MNHPMSVMMMTQATTRTQPFVFVDPQSAQIFALACRVAASSIPVLIAGPTGSGKEILARVVHEASPQAQGPFIAVNCAAIPATLAESLFFGHEKGAFTGANSSAAGYFEQAQNGTIFLDEIGEMPLELQPKILRALQERKITRLGGTREIAVNVRVLAATNVDLLEHTRRQRFREDLYYRLSAFKFNMPALAARKLDIQPLAYLMLQKYSMPGGPTDIAPCALEKLLSHTWPGNIRELENVMARATILTQTPTIVAADIVFDESAAPALAADAVPASPFVQAEPEQATAAGEGNLQATIQHAERRKILAALHSSSSRADAAKRLGISQRTLRHKLQTFRSEGHRVPDAYAR